MGQKHLGRIAVIAAMAGSVVALSAPIATATPAAHPNNAHPRFALGARLDAKPAAGHHVLALRAPADTPDSYDLSQYALSPGDQGQVGSCVSWALDYTGYGIEMNEQGLSGFPMAPMYTYSQIVQSDDGGQDQGSTPDETFQILESQGVDTQSDYSQGTTDYTDQPTQAETQNAANYRLSGHTSLDVGGSLQSEIEQSIAGGQPVAISINVHQSFQDITQQQAQDYSYMPGDSSSDPILGGHEITIIGYTSQGVRVENSWGSGWGDSGFINLSWAYVNQEVEEANAIGKLVQN